MTIINLSSTTSPRSNWFYRWVLPNSEGTDNPYFIEVVSENKKAGKLPKQFHKLNIQKRNMNIQKRNIQTNSTYKYKFRSPN